jgi:hypothetical protein
VTETLPDGWDQTSVSCIGANQSVENPAAITLEPGETVTCTFENKERSKLARFHVTKDFVPDNSMEVEVFISCTTGLPLQSSQVITEDSGGVTFIVKSFIPGELDCEVTEVPVPSGHVDTYLASIVDGEAGSIGNVDGCQFNEVVGGDFKCEITNTAEPATFTVYKDWVIENAGGDFIDLLVDVTISCESEIFENDAVEIDPDLWTLSGEIGDGGSLKATVDTTAGPAYCSAIEKVAQSSGVESVDDCDWRYIPAGGSDYCTFTNTVFFEGIPTLSQYGLMVLALLMLGVGAVGFRRFV